MLLCLVVKVENSTSIGWTGGHSIITGRKQLMRPNRLYLYIDLDECISVLSNVDLKKLDVYAAL